MHLYFKNINGNKDFANLYNWFEDADGTQQASDIPGQADTVHITDAQVEIATLGGNRTIKSLTTSPSSVNFLLSATDGVLRVTDGVKLDGSDQAIGPGAVVEGDVYFCGINTAANAGTIVGSVVLDIGVAAPGNFENAGRIVGTIVSPLPVNGTGTASATIVK